MYPFRTSNHCHGRLGIHHCRRSLEWLVTKPSSFHRLYVPNWRHELMVARVIVGIGGGITKVAAPALLHELAHPRLRATMGTMYYGFYHFGGAVSGVMCSRSSYGSPADVSRRLVCPEYRMAMANALFPSSFRPISSPSHRDHFARITPMARLQRSSRESSSHLGQTPCERERR